ncbi:MAG TPA: glycosyl hydrolase family 28-related protein [Mycobacterium sp.]|nr:glycosyl hydrolase family 28-related protein [Mycobacterium sp.]
MTSRRRLIMGAPAAAALAVLAGCQLGGRTVVDVRKFGARGDGAADDSRAIQAAAAALRSGGTLYFPPGTYRFAQRRPDGSAAIVITGVSDVDVQFDAGAELLMDNVDETARTGTSHGLLVRGPASRISLRNVNIRWVSDAKRSIGDGIRVVGCPAHGGALPAGWSGPRREVSRLTLSDCVIRRSPQAGVIMMGVSDISVAGLRVIDSRADGLHFNACRQARIEDYTAVDAGDDGLALVTYFARQFSFDQTAQTFSFPALTDWSNTDVVVKDVDIVRGRANGVRIAGANRVTIGGLRVGGVRSGAAVMVDSAAPGTDVGWNYVASRAVRVDDVTATDCDTGIHLLARPGASGDKSFREFDVHIGDAKVDGCDNWSVRAESLAEHRVSGLRIDDCSISSTSTTGGNGGVGIVQANGVSLGHVSIRHAEPVVAFKTVEARQLEVDRLAVTISASEQPEGTAAPCVSLDASDGVIAELEIDWTAAPTTWNAVSMSATEQCGGDFREMPVAIGSLKLTPPLGKSAITCQ